MKYKYEPGSEKLLLIPWLIYHKISVWSPSLLLLRSTTTLIYAVPLEVKLEQEPEKINFILSTELYN